MSKNTKLIKNTLYIFLGNFSSKFLSFLLVPLYTTLLTTSEYGTCDLVFTSALLLLPVFTLTIYEPMLRFSLDRSDTKSIFNCGFFVALIGFLFLLTLSPLILLFDAIAPYYWYCITYYFVYMLYQLVSYFLRGINEVKIYTIVGVVNTGCMLGLNIMFLLVLKIGTKGYLLANILSNLIAAATGFILARLYTFANLKIRPDKELIREMLRYSVPLIPNAVSWWVSNSSDRYMLSAIASVATCGVYAIAYKIPSIISSGATIFNSAWQLSAVDGFGSEETSVFFGKTYARLMTTLVLLAGLVILFSKQLARLLYQADFFAAWRVVPILVIAVVLNGLGGFIGTIFTSAKQTKNLMTTTLIGAGSNIALNAILIPSIGMYGAALATAISYFIIWLSRLYKAKSIMLLRRNRVQETVCLTVLSLEGALICLDTTVSVFVAALCFAALLMLRRDTFSELLSLARSLLKASRN